jgi:predicted permease
MNSWLLWAALLIGQNAAFTWVSRARNSGSLPYHAIAAVFSNGIWIISMFLVVDKLREAKGADEIALVAAFYTLFTVIGSVGMHWLSMRYFETGKRKVGA